MTNAYADLTTLKSAGFLNITGTGHDSRLIALLEAVARVIDRHCNRHFYVLVDTRKFDGNGGTELAVTDLISVTTLKTDDDKDRTFETTWAATDYLLYPLNAQPAKPWGRPYTRVLVDTEAGNEDVFTAGMQTVEIDGKWGYREVTEDSRADINAAGGLSSTATTVTVTDGAKFAVGQTVLIDSEQLYVTAISTNVLTINRAVNGTTAASHSNGADIHIYRYPGPVVEACLIQAARLWKRKDSGFTFGVGLPSTGTVGISRGLDQDLKHLLSPLRKAPVG